MSFIYEKTGCTYQSEAEAIRALLDHEPDLLDDDIADRVAFGIYEE